MATKTNKVKTVAQRREELENQLKDLEVLEYIEDEITDYIERAERTRNGYFMESYVAGYETEQATDSDGNALYTIDGEYGRLTIAELDSKGYCVTDSNVKPVHRPIWAEREIPESELSEYAKKRVQALDRVITFLNRYLEEA